MSQIQSKVAARLYVNPKSLKRTKMKLSLSQALTKDKDNRVTLNKFKTILLNRFEITLFKYHKLMLAKNKRATNI